MLGRAWQRLLSDRGRPHRALTRSELDLGQHESIDALQIGPGDVVVNCAAWTNVDGAEDHEDEATRINGHAVGRLAQRCAEVDALLVHYSTDYVFDGKAQRPYRIDAPHAPINAYGRSKAVGERLLWDSGARFLLLRTSWVYAPWGNNFVRTMARLGREKESLRVVDDQRGRPTSAEHLAATTLKLVERGVTGTLHVTDGGECTWFELARAVVGRVNPDCKVDPCTSDEFPRPAPRPAYSVLDLGPTESVVGPMPDWTTNVADVLARLTE